MGFGDFVGDVVDGAQDFAGGVAEGAQNLAGGVANSAQNLAGGVVNGVQQFASDPLGTITSPFGGGDPRGNDGGSSNWAAWGHEEIRSMLDNSVTPEDINEGARAWGDLQGQAVELVTGSTSDLRQTVSNGWRGESADAAVRSLTPVDEWANTLSTAMGNTAQLMDTSGVAAGQAKATVPEAPSHNWGRSLGSFALGGGPGALVDAVAQDRAQEEARMEAVRIMSTAYSAPINESRAAVPTYPQLADPTLQPPEHPPIGGTPPGGGGGGGGGAGAGGGGAGGGVPGGGVPGGGGGYQAPAAAALQGGPRGLGSPGSPASTAPQYSGPRPPGVPGGGGPGGGGLGPDAAGGAPFTPLGGAGGPAERAPRGFRGAGGLGGGRPGGVGGRAGSTGAAGFGPRGSGMGAASAAEGRLGAGAGGAAAGGVGGAAGGRGGAGGVPLAGAGAGRGQGGEDNEHRRPSYLVDTDDIFGDGRKVAPPVIGEDPPEYYR